MLIVGANQLADEVEVQAGFDRTAQPRVSVDCGLELGLIENDKPNGLLGSSGSGRRFAGKEAHFSHIVPRATRRDDSVPMLDGGNAAGDEQELGNLLSFGRQQGAGWDLPTGRQ